jgi:hypothetical protein
VVADAVVEAVVVVRAENITMASLSMPMRNNTIKEAMLQVVDGDEAADVVVVEWDVVAVEAVVDAVANVDRPAVAHLAQKTNSAMTC